MRRPTRLTAVLASLLLVLAACSGGDDDSGGDDSVADDGFGEVQAEEATIEVVEGDLGNYLVDGAGRTLYVFMNDEPGSSACNDSCAELWPAFSPNTIDADDLDTDLFTFIDRQDGTKQLAYDGRPLYYFASDNAPGQLNGQGSGGVWFIVSEVGDPIRDLAE